MTRRDGFCVIAALVGIAFASWFINTFPWFGWVVLAGALLYVTVGGIVVLARTSRSEVMSTGRLPRSRSSHLRSGSPGCLSTPGGSRDGRPHPQRDQGFPTRGHGGMIR